jgi:hypothetical protein
MQGAQPDTTARRPWRSTAAIVVAFLAVAIVSLATDQVLHVLKVYPPWGQPMSDPLFGLATAYRVVYTIAGGWLAARLAPNRPMWHAMVLGVVGLVVAGAGAAATWNRPDLGPAWYPLALVVTAVPCCWLGGVLYRMRHRDG